MIPNPLLLDVTPSGGHLLNVTGEPGDLAGLTLHGVHGPAVAVEVQTDGGPWTQVTYPYTLVAGVQLRLTRTDPSAVLTTIRATSPSSSSGGEAFTVSRGTDGYLTTTSPLGRDASGFLTTNEPLSRDADGFLSTGGTP